MKNILKKTTLHLAVVGLVACEQGSLQPGALQAVGPVMAQTQEYSTEELLGKTVAEYEALQAQAVETPATDKEAAPKDAAPVEGVVKNGYLQLDWDALIAPGYDPDSILERYEPLIASLEHGADGALDLYYKMEAEFQNAPSNEALADQKISLPGFIAPLEQSNGLITEFLLVPYFGACIHMPAPPSNQTVYVKVAADYAIKIEDLDAPIWVSGKMQLDNTKTEIGSASYQIQDGLISKYE